MKLSALLKGICVPPFDAEITGLSNNSARVKKDELFVAVKGYRHDGADFIDDALAAGAAAAITNSGHRGPRVINIKGDMRVVGSRLAARFWPDALGFLAAVTGTNGKSSVVNFLRQMWEFEGTPAASIGTAGVQAKGVKTEKTLTTPDAIDLHKELSQLSARGVRNVALETSSHGIEQHRADGLEIMAAGYTNLSNDHLDFYKDQDDYFKAKLRLFTDLLDPSGTAVVNMDDPRGKKVAAASSARGCRVITYGKGKSVDIRIAQYRVQDALQQVRLEIFGREVQLAMDLIAEFQIYNLACALGLFVASGGDFEKILPRLPSLRNEKGRTEKVGIAPSGAPIFVDFGHNGDGLKKLLTDFRPYVKKNLVCIVGSSGNRPEIRRIEMGRVLSEYADEVIIVDDDPRAEDPASIRAVLAANCPKAKVIPDRYAAIEEAIDCSRPWDSIMICGTRYEEDKKFIRAKLAPREVPLKELIPAGDARAITGICSNSQRAGPGSLFVGIKGYAKNGADYCLDAVMSGAAAVVVENSHKFDARTVSVMEKKKVFVSRTDDDRRTFADLAYRFYGSKQPDQVVAVTGTSGKSSVVDFVRQMWGFIGHPAISTGTIGIIAENIYSERRIIKYSEDHTTPTGDEPYKWFSYFKDKGVERAAAEMSSHGIDQRRMSGIRFVAGGFTNLGTDHQDFYGGREKYLEAKARMFSECVEPEGGAVLNADIPEYEYLAKVCRDRGLKIITYGHHADMGLISHVSTLEGQQAEVELFGKPYCLNLKILGDFQLMNMLCALSLFMFVENDWERVMPHLGRLKNALGRLEFMGRTAAKAAVYIDFAYKGDALRSTLMTLRKLTKGRIILVFSTCGDVYEAERRRRELGSVAARLADISILTDDSPRTEDPAKIRAEVEAHCPGVENFARGRKAAIRRAMELARKDDVVLVAGKGHEDYVTVGSEDIPYSDQQAVKELFEEGL